MHIKGLSSLLFFVLFMSACHLGQKEVVEVTRLAYVTREVVITPTISKEAVYPPSNTLAEQSSVEIETADMTLDGKYLALLTSQGLYLYTSNRFQKLWFQPLQQQQWYLKFSPDGKWIALVGAPSPMEKGQAEIRAVETGKVVQVLSPSSRWRSIDWSPNSEAFVTSTFDGEIIQWELATGKPVLTIQEQGACWSEGMWQSNVVWSSDGDRIISSCTNGTLAVWSANDGATDFRTDRSQFGGLFPALTFASPLALDTRIAVTAGNFERAIMVIDGRTGKLISKIEVQFLPAKIAWSPDGEMLAVGETAANAAELIDLQTHKVYNVIYIDSRNGIFWPLDGSILYFVGLERIIAVNSTTEQIG